MNAETKYNFHKNMTEEDDEQLFYALVLMGMPGHIDLKDIFLTEEVSSDLVIVGPYGIWLAGNDYLGGVVYQENGVYLREKMDLVSNGISNSRIDILEEVEERWLMEKEAVENVISSSFPLLLNEFPLLIRGGVCLAQHDNGLKRIFPAAYGLDEDREDENNDLGRPHDRNGIPIEPILSETQVKQIADALFDNSMRLIGSLTEILFEQLFSDQEKEELRFYAGDLDGIDKSVEGIVSKRKQETDREDSI